MLSELVWVFCGVCGECGEGRLTLFFFSHRSIKVMILFRYLSVLFLIHALRAEATVSCYFYTHDGAKVLYSSDIVGDSLNNPVCVRYCYKCEADDGACSAADVQASATLDKYFLTGSLVELTTANMMQNMNSYKKLHVCSTDGCNDYVEGYCDDPNSGTPTSTPSSSGISALNGLLGLISASVVAFVLV